MADRSRFTGKRPRVRVAICDSVGGGSTSYQNKFVDGTASSCIVDFEKSEIGQDLLRSLNCTDTPSSIFE